MAKTGQLYIVATPIGNLADISPRAVSVLAEVKAIAAEDTRHSTKLLSHYQISTPMIAVHEHNEVQAASKLIGKLTHGADVALITDAGTPAISDPGHKVVKIVREQGISVVAIPGPCAIVTALSISGMKADQFVFEGFLEAKQTQRLKQLQTLRQETRTLVFYEAPHRITKALKDMVEVFGAGRQVALAHELTKMHEEVIVKPLGELVSHVKEAPALSQGEYVIVVEGCEKAETKLQEIQIEHLLQCLLAELPLKQAVALAAKITGLKRKPLYDLALILKNS